MSELLFIEKAYNFFVKCADYTIDYFSNIDYKIIAFRGFIFYGQCMTNVNNFYKNMYQKYEYVRHMSYTTTYAFKYIKSIIYLHRIEPMYINWYSNCWIDRYCLNEYDFNEKIKMFPENTNHLMIDDIESNWIIDPIFIGKSQIFELESEIESSGYYCRRINSQDIEKDDVQYKMYPLLPSSIHFLSIMYKHPLMDYDIDIQMDNSWFMNGNEILSPSFIYRLLEYQAQKFVFDMDYQIIIMDENINILYLNSNQYMFILEHGYEIIDIDDKPISETYEIVDVVDEDVVIGHVGISDDYYVEDEIVEDENIEDENIEDENIEDDNEVVEDENIEDDNEVVEDDNEVVEDENIEDDNEVVEDDNEVVEDITDVVIDDVVIDDVVIDDVVNDDDKKNN